jgi:DNA-binding CsgD family transcriptional regulator
VSPRISDSGGAPRTDRTSEQRALPVARTLLQLPAADVPKQLAPGPSAADRIQAALLQPADIADGSLSPRELEIVVLACQGLKHGEIGVCLGINAQSVRRHLRHAQERTGSQSVAHLITRAHRSGLIPYSVGPPAALSDEREIRSGARSPLTDAQREIVWLLAEGHRPKEIAWMRDVQISTVRSQIKAAKKKTSARTIEELIRVTSATARSTG